MSNKDIATFRRNFYDVYHNKIVPALKPFEQERLKARKKPYVSAIKISLFSTVGIILFFLVKGVLNVNACIFAILLEFVFFLKYLHQTSNFHKKSFEYGLKEKIMPILMPAFGDIKWNPKVTVSSEEIHASLLYPLFDKMKNDDSFLGSYKDVPIRITETKLTYEITNRDTKTEFKGVIISLDIPKKFTGHTIVQKRGVVNIGPYEEVILEGVDFAKEFYVSSTDQIEARYLLTTAFMQRFKNIQKAFNATSINCSFLNNKMLIAVSVNKDLFSLGNLDTPVTDTKQFTTFFDEIVSIYEIIEELKLYQNIGM